MIAIGFLGALASAVWKGLTENEDKSSKLKEALSASVSQNQEKIDRYINEHKNSIVAQTNQLTSDVDKKVYEIVVYQSPLKDSNSLPSGLSSEEIKGGNLEAASPERGLLTDVAVGAYKIVALVCKIAIGDWNHSEKPRILQIESDKNKISSPGLDSNQIENLAKNLSQKKVGELAVISSDQSLITSVSNSILTSYQQACHGFSKSVNQIFTIKNPFSFPELPPKEELKKSLEDQIPLNQTRVDNYINQYTNGTEFNNGTILSPTLDEGHNQTKIGEIFERLVKDSTIKLSTEDSLISDLYRNFGRAAVFTVVFGGLLSILYKTICEQRKTKTLKKFQLLSKKALIHDRFEKIQKENLKVKQLKEQAELKKLSLLVSQINAEKLPSEEKAKVQVKKVEQASSINEFSRAVLDAKKLFESTGKPLNLKRIYQFITL